LRTVLMNPLSNQEDFKALVKSIEQHVATLEQK